MPFNPLDMFSNKSKPTSPPRGPGGKFISTKEIVEQPDGQEKKTRANTQEAERITIKKVAKTNKNIDSQHPSGSKIPVGPYPVTFYQREVRRYYQDNAWYFSVDDVARIADNNPDTPNLRKGDAEKLEQALAKFGRKIDKVEVAKPADIAKFVPYFKGNMPGPVVAWLIQSAENPAPGIEDYTSIQEQSLPQSLPQDTNQTTTHN